MNNVHWSMIQKMLGEMSKIPGFNITFNSDGLATYHWDNFIFDATYFCFEESVYQAFIVIHQHLANNRET